MKLYVIVVLMLFSQFQLFAKGLDYAKGYYSLNGNLTNILNVNENEIYVYGELGIIKKTSDAGKTWSQVFSSTKHQIIQLKAINNQIIGIDAYGLIIKSYNNGRSWNSYYISEIDSINGTQSFLAFDMNRNGVGLISSSDNQLYLTDDYAVSFKRINANLQSKVTAIYVKEDMFFLGTEDSKLYVSKDYGENWEQSVLDFSNDQVKDIQSNNSALLITTNKRIYHYDLTLKKVNIIKEQIGIQSCKFKDDSHIIVQYKNAESFVDIEVINVLDLSFEKNRIYFPKNTYNKLKINEFELVNDSIIMMVGDNISIIMYDMFRKHTEIKSHLAFSVNTFLYNVKFLDSNYGVIASNRNDIFVTSDKGVTWYKSQIYGLDTTSSHSFDILNMNWNSNYELNAGMVDGGWQYTISSTDTGRTFVAKRTYLANGSELASSFLSPFWLGKKLYSFYYDISKSILGVKSHFYYFDEAHKIRKSKFIGDFAIGNPYVLRNSPNSFYIESKKYNQEDINDNTARRKLHLCTIIDDELQIETISSFESDSLLSNLTEFNSQFVNDSSGFATLFPAKKQLSDTLVFILVKFEIRDKKFLYEILHTDSIPFYSYEYSDSIIKLFRFNKLQHYSLKTKELQEFPLINTIIYNWIPTSEYNIQVGMNFTAGKSTLFRSIEPEFITSVETTEIQEKAHLQFTAPYPIPAQNYVKSTIYWNSVYDINLAKFSVSDVFGNSIPYHNLSIEQTDTYKGLLNWDCTGISSGVYFIRVQLGAETIIVPVAVGK